MVHGTFPTRYNSYDSSDITIFLSVSLFINDEELFNMVMLRLIINGMIITKYEAVVTL